MLPLPPVVLRPCLSFLSGIYICHVLRPLPSYQRHAEANWTTAFRLPQIIWTEPKPVREPSEFALVIGQQYTMMTFYASARSETCWPLLQIADPLEGCLAIRCVHQKAATIGKSRIRVVTAVPTGNV